MSKFFVNRPIVAIVMALLMIILGAVSLVQLPVAQYPDIVPPEILVQANYVGADALTVQESVASPLEDQMSGVDNMSYMYSVNANNGLMQLHVIFKVGTDANTGQILAQMRSQQANASLPPEVLQLGVTVDKAYSSPLLLISLHSPNGTYDKVFLSNYALINLRDPLTRVTGVGRVQIFGGGEYALRCWVNPDQLARLSITIPEIVAAIEAQNTVNPAGQIGAQPAPPGQEFTYNVRAAGRLVTPKDFGEIILRARPDGSLLRLRDVARLELGAQTYNTDARFNGKPAAIIALYQLPGSNAVDAANGVRALMAQLQERFPSDIAADLSLDTTLAVREGMREIVVTLLIAIVLVALVVFLFLQDWRATLIPLAAVPVSLVGTFAVFPLLGFSINTLSLFGLVLAIGLVVDDAIVVVEAVQRHIDEGMNPHDAALKAMDEVAAPVVAVALILAAVFIPTAFVPGISGRLYQQFAVTVAVSVLLSAVNALTLSPALSALLLRPRPKDAHGPMRRLFVPFNRGFAATTEWYLEVSELVAHRVGFAFLALGLAVVASFVISRRVPSAFVPREDQGYAFVALQLPDAASLQRTDAAATQVEEILRRTPGVQSYISIIGFSLLSQVQATYNGFFFVTLKPWHDRKKKEEQFAAIQAHLNGALSRLSQGNAFAFPPPDIPGIGTSGGVTFVLQDQQNQGVAYLAENTKRFLAAARQRPELSGLTTTLLPSVPQLFVAVDRPRVIAQGVSLPDVYRTMQAFMGGTFVNYFNRFGKQWQVYIQAEGEHRTRPEDIGGFYVRNAQGGRVPLSALARVEPQTGPEFTTRYNAYSSSFIYGSAAPGYSTGQAMKAFEQAFAESMPADMGYAWLGMSYQEQLAEQGISLVVVFALSLVVVFLILAALYESWTLPFGVLLTLPIAVFGAFLALMLRGLENTVYADIGLVMLVGLSAKNAILIVEFAKKEADAGRPIDEATIDAARVRFRPILMTSLAFIMGAIPLAIASGAAGAARQVVGTTVIGGMLAATMLAVFIIPASYSVIAKLAARGGRRSRAKVARPSDSHGADTA